MAKTYLGKLASLPTSSIRAIDDRRIAAMRLVLSTCALAIIIIDPTQPDRLIDLTYEALALYTFYSLFVLVLATRGTSLLATTGIAEHWVDVAWYALLISLSSGTSSIFYFGFFFAILVASFQHGLTAGLRVTLASALLFAVISMAIAPRFAQQDLNRFLLRPIYLIVIGYMMAYWGGLEIAHKNRLTLLKELAMLSNVRSGVDRILNSMVEKTRQHFGADTALLIISDGTADTVTMYVAGEPFYSPETGNIKSTAADKTNMVLRRSRGEDPNESRLSIGVQKLLLSLPSDRAVLYNGTLSRSRKLSAPTWMHPWRPRSGTPLYYPFDMEPRGAQRLAGGEELSRMVASALGSRSFISMPVSYGSFNGRLTGRLYLASRLHTFDEAQVQFLAQAVAQVVPTIENILLVDRLASDAAEEERQRIARDIHDTVVQPYIGLQMWISAVHQKLRAGLATPALTQSSRLIGSHRGALAYDENDLQDLVSEVMIDLGRLRDRADEEIDDLRGFVRELTGDSARVGSLLPAIRRFAAKFSGATGIEVSVDAPDDMHIHDRLAAEAFQMVAEGLSNIRRHTHAAQARVSIARSENDLILSIENDDVSNPQDFVPRSIAARATALGGFVRVQQTDEGRCAVSVRIPLSGQVRR